MAPTTTWARDFDVKKLGLREGLSSNYIIDVKQDKWGFMWFATEEGLNRFDGSRFTTYYKGPGQLTGNGLNCLLDDPHRPILWIGTQYEGLNAFNYATDEFTYFRHDDKNKSTIITNDITDMVRAYDGNMWLTTYWGGLEHFDYKTQKFTHYNKKTVRGMTDDQLWCVCDLGDGLVLVGHVSHGVTLINTRTRQAKNYRANHIQPTSLQSDEVNSLYKDPFGNVWIGTSKGLCHFDLGNDKITPIHHAQLDGYRIFDIKISENHRLMVASEQNGIVLLDSPQQLQNKQVYHTNHITEGDTRHNLSGNTVRSFCEDRHHNLWVGTYGSGVSFITNSLPPIRKMIYGVNSDEFLTDRSVLSLVVDRRNHLFVGTDGKGLVEYSPEKRRIAEYSLGNKTAVQAAYKDHDGTLWFGAYTQGVYIHSGSSITHILEHIDARSFYDDKKGRMWIGASDGIYVVDKKTHQVRERYMEGRLVRAMHEDRQGNVWVSVLGNGIYVYNQHKKLIKEFNAWNGLPSNNVEQFLLDRQGRIWAATIEGIVCFDRQFMQGKYKVYTKKDGQANTLVRAIAEDREGNIWATTSKGLSCLRKGTRRFINFGYNDNIVVGDFVAQCVAEGPDGTLYFGTNGAGLNYFNPKEMFAPRKSPHAFITGLHLFHNTGSEVEDSTINLIGKKEIYLEYAQNTFDIDFNVQEFQHSHCVEYSYRLEDIDDDWTYTSKNKAIFHDVPFGTHKLQVRCHLRNQPWPKEYTELTLHIAAPWYLRWWMQLLYTLLFIGLVWFSIRAYIHHIRLKYQLQSEKTNLANEQALSDERMRFYTNITHELRTPLTLILGPLEDISRRTDLPEVVSRQIEMIHQSATRLNGLITTILEFRKTATDNRELMVTRGNIVDCVEETILKYQELNRKKNVDIRFFASDKDIEIYYDKDVIGMIMDNLVSNAVKYTDAGSIDISVDRRRLLDKHLVDITVSDTGHGIAKNAQAHIFDRYYQEMGAHQASGTGIGLALVKQLVELHQGTIQVESSLEEGTSFIVSLNEENVYPKAQRSKQPGNTVAKAVDTPVDQTQDKPIMLIVEDNYEIREYIAESFAEDFTVEQADNGQEGLAKALETIPDIIISDIMMPKMDGNTMCRTLKDDMRTSHIPILLLTAKDTNEAKMEGYNAGADSYITKPFTHSLLATRVNNLLQQRHRMAKALTEQTNVKHEEKKPETVGQAFMLVSAITAAKKADEQEHTEDSTEANAPETAPADVQHQPVQVNLSATDQKFMEKVNKFIEEHIQGDLDVNMMADHVAMSGSTLYRKMKALTGLSTNEYIRKFKMHYAEQLMHENKYSMNEISFKVGINSIAYFRKSFKAEFGELPSDYMKKRELL